MTEVQVAEMPNPQVIALTITHWLHQEIANADQGLNFYLSDFDNRQPDLFKAFDDPDNFSAQKTISHHNRLARIVSQYPNEDNRFNDFFTGTIIHHALMGVAGGFRRHCLMATRDFSSYMEMRQLHHPVSPDVNVAAEVTQTMDDMRPVSGDSVDIEEQLDLVVKQTLQVNDRNLELVRFMHDECFVGETTVNGRAAAPNSPPVEITKETQRMMLGVSAAHIVLAANIRGDYSKVPFLEPKSMTDVSDLPIYPISPDYFG